MIDFIRCANLFALWSEYNYDWGVLVSLALVLIIFLVFGAFSTKSLRNAGRRVLRHLDFSPEPLDIAPNPGESLMDEKTVSGGFATLGIILGIVAMVFVAYVDALRIENCNFSRVFSITSSWDELFYTKVGFEYELYYINFNLEFSEITTLAEAESFCHGNHFFSVTNLYNPNGTLIPVEVAACRAVRLPGAGNEVGLRATVYMKDILQLSTVPYGGPGVIFIVSEYLALRTTSLSWCASIREYQYDTLVGMDAIPVITDYRKSKGTANRDMPDYYYDIGEDTVLFRRGCGTLFQTANSDQGMNATVLSTSLNVVRKIDIIDNMAYEPVLATYEITPPTVYFQNPSLDPGISWSAEWLLDTYEMQSDCPQFLTKLYGIFGQCVALLAVHPIARKVVARIRNSRAQRFVIIIVYFGGAAGILYWMDLRIFADDAVPARLRKGLQEEYHMPSSLRAYAQLVTKLATWVVVFEFLMAVIFVFAGFYASYKAITARKRHGKRRARNRFKKAANVRIFSSQLWKLNPMKRDSSDEKGKSIEMKEVNNAV